MSISLIKEEEKHILRILPILLKEDVEFKKSLYEVLGETFTKKDDFSELKEIVKDIGIKIEQLAEAQKRTEEEIRKLAIGLNNLRGDVGGLSRTFGYAFENEAYRMLPKTLKKRYGIELTEKLIRTEIDEKEINIIGFGKRDGVEVIIVGEVKTRLEKMEVFDELEEKVRIVKERYKDKEIVKILVTHFATTKILKVASDNEIIVIQSFEWEM